MPLIDKHSNQATSYVIPCPHVFTVLICRMYHGLYLTPKTLTERHYSYLRPSSVRVVPPSSWSHSGICLNLSWTVCSLIQMSYQPSLSSKILPQKSWKAKSQSRFISSVYRPLPASLSSGSSGGSGYSSKLPASPSHSTLGIMGPLRLRK